MTDVTYWYILIKFQKIEIIDKSTNSGRQRQKFFIHKTIHNGEEHWIGSKLIAKALISNKLVCEPRGCQLTVGSKSKWYFWILQVSNSRASQGWFSRPLRLPTRCQKSCGKPASIFEVKQELLTIANLSLFRQKDVRYEAIVDFMSLTRWNITRNLV